MDTETDVHRIDITITDGRGDLVSSLRGDLIPGSYRLVLTGAGSFTGDPTKDYQVTVTVTVKDGDTKDDILKRLVQAYDDQLRQMFAW